jgi:hypothetical protein
MKNEKKILRCRFINLEEVFEGENVPLWRNNLFKYCVKSFGCAVAELGVNVPTDLKELLFLDQFRTDLKITCAVNESVFLLPSYRKLLQKGKLECIGDDDKNMVSGYWREAVSWFNFYYWYNIPPNGDFGSIWIADTTHLYLGSYYPPKKQEMIKGILETLKCSEDPDDVSHYRAYKAYEDFWDKNYFPQFEQEKESCGDN